MADLLITPALLWGDTSIGVKNSASSVYAMRNAEHRILSQEVRQYDA